MTVGKFNEEWSIHASSFTDLTSTLAFSEQGTFIWQFSVISPLIIRFRHTSQLT